MKLKIKIIVTNDKDESFMGIGLVWLLENIKKHKSINSAAKEMKMSYAKAFKILKHLEKNLGEKVITRQHGGNERYGAELTPFGEKLIKRFNSFNNNVLLYAEKEFKKFNK